MVVLRSRWGFLLTTLGTTPRKNVDVIIPLAELDQLRADIQFWDARDATNAELADRGLYITHLFTEADAK